jgi:hypothetical protein
VLGPALKDRDQFFVLLYDEYIDKDKEVAIQGEMNLF